MIGYSHFCSLILVSLCVARNEKQSKDDSSELKDVLEETAIFIPSISTVITVGSKLYDLYNKYQQYLENPLNDDTDISKARLYIENKIDNVKSHVLNVNKRIGNVIEVVPNERTLSDRLDRVHSVVVQINNYFERYKKLYHPSRLLSSESAKKFEDEVFRIFRLDSQLVDLHNILMGEKQGGNLLNNFNLTTEIESLMCSKTNSYQNRLNQIYYDILITEIKALQLIQFRYKVMHFTKSISDVENRADLKLFVTNSVERIRSTASRMKEAIEEASREFWICDRDFIEGLTYVKLGPIFQTYILPPYDAVMVDWKTMQGKEVGHCDDHGVLYDLCRRNPCRNNTGLMCNGELRNCQAIPDVDLCANDGGDERRYKYVTLRNNTVWGDETQPCKTNKFQLSQQYRFGLPIKIDFFELKLCACVCDETYRDDLDRYFNLRDVTSDIDGNKVVTGVRLVRDKKLIHIQVQQAELAKNGKITVDSLEWKRIEKFNLFNRNAFLGRDYHKIVWDKRTVHLDDIEAPPGALVTGLRFKQEKDYLKLEIRYTPFDYTSGQLSRAKSRWISGSEEKRKEMKFSTRLPSSDKINEISLVSSGYSLEFTTSDNVEDVGSNVVPFIDISPVVVDNPTPLSGVGLMYRGNRDTSGFLALKILTLDYSMYLTSPLRNGAQAYVNYLLEKLKNETLSVNATEPNQIS